jgi:hypothetical protein
LPVCACDPSPQILEERLLLFLIGHVQENILPSFLLSELHVLAGVIDDAVSHPTGLDISVGTSLGAERLQPLLFRKPGSAVLLSQNEVWKTLVADQMFWMKGFLITS